MARLVGDQEALALCLFNRAGASKHWGMGSDEAVPFLTECLELYREMGDRPLDEASCIQSLAACEIGDDHGESLARQAHEMFREHLGPDHHKTVGAQWVLGQILLLQGKAADAEPLLRQTLEMYENIYDKDHPKNQVVRRKLAACLTLQGNRDEANEILKGAPQATEPLEVMYCLYYHNVVDQLAKQERYQEAVPILDEMRNKYDGVQSKFGPDHRITKLYQNALAKLYAMTGQQEEARKWYDEADGETDTNGAREEQIQQIRTDVSRLLGIEDAELPSSVPGD